MGGPEERDRYLALPWRVEIMRHRPFGYSAKLPEIAWGTRGVDRLWRVDEEISNALDRRVGAALDAGEELPTN